MAECIIKLTSYYFPYNQILICLCRSQISESLPHFQWIYWLSLYYHFVLNSGDDSTIHLFALLILEIRKEFFLETVRNQTSKEYKYFYPIDDAYPLNSRTEDCVSIRYRIKPRRRGIVRSVKAIFASGSLHPSSDFGVLS
jgi:hypothetical protein